MAETGGEPEATSAADYEERLQKLSAEAATLRREKRGPERMLRLLRQDLDTRTGEVKALESQLAERDETLQDQTGKLEVLRTQLAKLQQLMSRHGNSLRRGEEPGKFQRGGSAEAEQQITGMREELDTSRSRVGELEAELRIKEEQLQDLLTKVHTPETESVCTTSGEQTGQFDASADDSRETQLQELRRQLEVQAAVADERDMLEAAKELESQELSRQIESAHEQEICQLKGQLASQATSLCEEEIFQLRDQLASQSSAHEREVGELLLRLEQQDPGQCIDPTGDSREQELQELRRHLEVQAAAVGERDEEICELRSLVASQATTLCEQEEQLRMVPRSGSSAQQGPSSDLEQELGLAQSSGCSDLEQELSELRLQVKQQAALLAEQLAGAPASEAAVDFTQDGEVEAQAATMPVVADAATNGSMEPEIEALQRQLSQQSAVIQEREERLRSLQDLHEKDVQEIRLQIEDRLKQAELAAEVRIEMLVKAERDATETAAAAASQLDAAEVSRSSLEQKLADESVALFQCQEQLRSITETADEQLERSVEAARSSVEACDQAARERDEAVAKADLLTQRGAEKAAIIRELEEQLQTLMAETSFDDGARRRSLEAAPVARSPGFGTQPMQESPSIFDIPAVVEPEDSKYVPRTGEVSEGNKKTVEDVKREEEVHQATHAESNPLPPQGEQPNRREAAAEIDIIGGQSERQPSQVGTLAFVRITPTTMGGEPIIGSNAADLQSSVQSPPTLPPTPAPPQAAQLPQLAQPAQTVLPPGPAKQDFDLSAPGKASYEALDGELAKWKEGLLRIRHAVTEPPQDAPDVPHPSSSTDYKALLRECGQELAEAVSTLRRQMSPERSGAPLEPVSTLRRQLSPERSGAPLEAVSTLRRQMSPERSGAPPEGVSTAPRSDSPLRLRGEQALPVAATPNLGASLRLPAPQGRGVAAAPLAATSPAMAAPRPARASPCLQPRFVPAPRSVVLPGSASPAPPAARAPLPPAAPPVRGCGSVGVLPVGAAAGRTRPASPKSPLRVPSAVSLMGARVPLTAAGGAFAVGNGEQRFGTPTPQLPSQGEVPGAQDALSRSLRVAPAPLVRSGGSAHATVLRSVSQPLIHAATACSPATQRR